SLSLFRRSASPPYLHSFPTRRSSDLRGFVDVDDHVALETAAALAGGGDDFHVILVRLAPSDGAGELAAPHVYAGDNFWFRQGTRSEEHTSELQSLAYLVCRLLLAKKN